MRIDVFNEALELRNKQILCEDIMKYLSDPDAVKGMKYKELLATFAKTFESEFMIFVHNMGVNAGMAFEDLHDCCPDCGCNGDTDEPQTPPEDAKFKIGDRVEVVAGILDGSIGTVEDYKTDTSSYGVRLDRFPADALLQWFSEDEIKPYTEEVENPEEPNVPKFKEGDIVRIVGGEKDGALARILYIDETDKTYRVEPVDESFIGDLWYPEYMLELYTEPENPDENGGTTDTDEGE